MKPTDFYITPDEYSIAKSNGICRKTLEDRIRRLGWDKKKAITQKPQKSFKIEQKYLDIALRNGIPKKIVYMRIRKYKWEVYRAITEPVNDRTELMKRLGKSRKIYSDEIIALANKNGINKKTFCSRVNRGWTQEVAATHPIISKSEAGKMSRKDNKLEDSYVY